MAGLSWGSGMKWGAAVVFLGVLAAKTLLALRQAAERFRHEGLLQHLAPEELAHAA